ncbi:sulfatase-like hydrolase/transferase [Candidatus Coxiella mudrowiae]|uniref:sulfatase-like hydrolase/transferase n=1 Tax=Candidatus Coxiella mudrowiae TaxID=2054173 RepID=UPI0027D322F2|nr:sulfatase-like hydrolase/transferase [Candidatus Coxiella mudrowiae]
MLLTRYPYLNRYRNAAHFDDALVGQVLQALKGHQLLKNTIVIITADHGEEFNENHQNYWGMRAIIHRDKCIHL